MISDKLKEIREKTGMNKKEFADYLGVKYTTYNNYEVGSREPASDFLIMISKKFDISIDYIMGLSEEKEKSYHYQLKSCEYEHIKKYRALDPLSREIVDFVIEKESERKKAQEKENKTTTLEDEDSEYIEFAARGGKFRLDKETAAKLAESAKNAPNSSQDRDMF